VGDVDAGDLQIFVQLADLQPHLHPQLGVQVGQRLIEQEDLGLAHDAAPHGHALALAAGKLAGLAVEQVAQLENLGGVANAAVDFVHVHAAHLEAVGHVLVDRHVGIKRVILEDHGDIAVGGLEPVDHPAFDGDLAAADLLQPGDETQQG
jgi:hypothetical protein